MLITLSAATLLIGYIMRWSYAPLAMIVLFAYLSPLCAIEIFYFLENESRYFDFVREFFCYVLISTRLVRSKRMRRHFGEVTIVPTARD